MKTAILNIFFFLILTAITHAQNVNINKSEYIFRYLKDGDTSNISQLVPREIIINYLNEESKNTFSKDKIDSIYLIDIWLPLKQNLRNTYADGSKIGINWNDITIKNNKSDTVYSNNSTTIKQVIYFQSVGKQYLLNVSFIKIPMSKYFIVETIFTPRIDENANKKQVLARKYRNAYITSCGQKMAKNLKSRPTQEQQAKLNGKCDCSFNKLSDDNYITEIERTINKSDNFLSYYDCEKECMVTEQSLNK